MKVENPNDFHKEELSQWPYPTVNGWEKRWIYCWPVYNRLPMRLFSTHDLIALDLIYRNQPLPESAKQRIPKLVEEGLLEHPGRKRFILSRKFHAFLGKKGVYTRKRGLDRETNKELLLKHIKNSGADGSKFEEFTQVLPSHSRGQIQGLLKALRKEGRIQLKGQRKAAQWFTT